MSTKVTVAEKKNFIRWLLNNYQFKKRECVWILNYVISHDKLLEKFHFVEGGVQFCPRGMFMSTLCADGGVPFRYYKENVSTTDCEKSFHDIRLNRDDDVYVYINFSGKHLSQNQEVLEVNKFVPEEKRPENQYTKEVDKLIEKVMMDTKLKELEDKIDESLESGDKETFLAISKEYSKLRKQHDRKYKKKATKS